MAPGWSTRETVIVEPDCATENVSEEVSLPYQLALLTVDGHVFAVPISTAFEPPAALVPTVTSVTPMRQQFTFTGGTQRTKPTGVALGHRMRVLECMRTECIITVGGTKA